MHSPRLPSQHWWYLPALTAAVEAGQHGAVHTDYTDFRIQLVRIGPQIDLVDQHIGQIVLSAELPLAVAHVDVGLEAAAATRDGDPAHAILEDDCLEGVAFPVDVVGHQFEVVACSVVVVGHHFEAVACSVVVVGHPSGVVAYQLVVGFPAVVGAAMAAVAEEACLGAAAEVAAAEEAVRFGAVVLEADTAAVEEAARFDVAALEADTAVEASQNVASTGQVLADMLEVGTVDDRVPASPAAVMVAQTGAQAQVPLPLRLARASIPRFGQVVAGSIQHIAAGAQPQIPPSRLPMVQRSASRPWQANPTVLSGDVPTGTAMTRPLLPFALARSLRPCTRLTVPLVHSHPYSRWAPARVALLAQALLPPQLEQVSPTLSYHHSRCNNMVDHWPDLSIRSNQEGEVEG